MDPNQLKVGSSYRAQIADGELGPLVEINKESVRLEQRDYFLYRRSYSTHGCHWHVFEANFTGYKGKDFILSPRQVRAFVQPAEED